MSPPGPVRVTVLVVGDAPAIHALRAIEFSLGAVPGVHGVEVARDRATVTHDASVTDAMLRAAVELAGSRVLRVDRTRTLPIV
ncbi:MAG: heavy-metal-associated domain-containing protein [Gemmatimonadaceae bacterium]|nr:heavy-metal-associated domain-containing protein [Gemmatimonadaceae bacterium]